MEEAEDILAKLTTWERVREIQKSPTLTTLEKRNLGYREEPSPFYSSEDRNWKEVLDTWVGCPVAKVPSGVRRQLEYHGYDCSCPLVQSWRQRQGGPVPTPPRVRGYVELDLEKERTERYSLIKKLFAAFSKRSQETMAVYLQSLEKVPWYWDGAQVFRDMVEHAIQTQERLPSIVGLIRIAGRNGATYTPNGAQAPRWMNQTGIYLEPGDMAAPPLPPEQRELIE